MWARPLLVRDDDWNLNITTHDDVEVEVYTLPGNMYNLIFGVNPMAEELAFMLGLAVLDNKDGKYKVYRFRDLYVSDHGTIVLYTRAGGNNRQYCDSADVYRHPLYQRTWDEKEDGTYCYYEFAIPSDRQDILTRAKENKCIGVYPGKRFRDYIARLEAGVDK